MRLDARAGAAAADDPAEEAAREPDPGLAVTGAPPSGHADAGERRESRQNLAGPGLVDADRLVEVGGGAVPEPQGILAGEDDEGVEPVARAGVAFGEDQGGVFGRGSVVGHAGLSFVGGFARPGQAPTLGGARASWRRPNRPRRSEALGSSETGSGQPARRPTRIRSIQAPARDCGSSSRSCRRSSIHSRPSALRPS